jgi:hypothetical protein
VLNTGIMNIEHPISNLQLNTLRFFNAHHRAS